MNARTLWIGEGEKAAVTLAVNTPGELLVQTWLHGGRSSEVHMRTEHAMALANSLLDYVEWAQTGKSDEGPWT